MLTRFPNGARCNSKLSELNLQHNRLSLKRKIKRHPYVQKVGLQHHNITQVPASMRKFTNLRKLNFNYNKINSVHPPIRLLNKLEQLSFYHNELEVIPSGVYQIQSLQLDNLEELDVSHDFISEIPEAVFDFKHLKILSLVSNPYNEKTIEFIQRRVCELRARNVFVHISDSDPSN